MKNNINITAINLHDGTKIEKMPPCVMCLGNFDGVHTGHKALLDRAKKQKGILSAKYKNAVCGVVTFNESTYDMLSENPPPKITNFEDKAALFSHYGMDVLVTMDFGDVRNLFPEDFVSIILKKYCNCVMTICGFNYHFGLGGAGNHETLSELMNNNAVTVAPVVLDGKIVSSTEIRTSVTNGDIVSANRMLGRAFSLSGTVEHGRGVGNTLGFATINQHFKQGYLLPKKGVYVSSCTVNDIDYPAVSDIGTHPTFGKSNDTRCETHIIGLCDNLYGREITTRFYKYLRPEKKFDSAAELCAEVKKNIKEAEEYFKLNKIK